MQYLETMYSAYTVYYLDIISCAIIRYLNAPKVKSMLFMFFGIYTGWAKYKSTEWKIISKS